MIDVRCTAFLGGCPGAGKSFLAENVIRTCPGVRHENAGTLIRAALGATTEGNERLVVATGDVADRYQLLLIERFHEIRAAHQGTVLLDGHFVVPTKTGLHPVPASVFRALGIDVFVLVESAPDIVVQRLCAREPQGWWDGARRSVTELIQLERERAEGVSRELGRPLLRIDSEAPDAAVRFRLAVEDTTRAP